ncbi:MAG: sigma-E processing peptidase SpoIIGA [Tissierellaceae bacterium]
MYIVAEYLFIENLLINYIILYIGKLMTKTEVKRVRIFIASAIAGLYPFLLFTSSAYFFMNFLVKILVSVLIIKLAYGARSIRLFIKQFIAFYTISFIFAGASIGLYFFLANLDHMPLKFKDMVGNFPARYLVLGISLGGIMIKDIFEYYGEKSIRNKEVFNIHLSLRGETVFIKMLNDSGNSLIEPISKLPVAIVEYHAISDILPPCIREVFDLEKESDFLYLESLIRKLGKDMTLRLIPFKSIGSSNGLLLGFKPDYIRLPSGKKYRDIFVAIYNSKLSTDEQYRGLINLEIIKGRGIYDDENSGEIQAITI